MKQIIVAINPQDDERCGECKGPQGTVDRYACPWMVRRIIDQTIASGEPCRGPECKEREALSAALVEAGKEMREIIAEVFKPEIPWDIALAAICEGSYGVEYAQGAVMSRAHKLARYERSLKMSDQAVMSSDLLRPPLSPLPKGRYIISTSFELPGAHQLELPYASKCQNLHGHTYRFTITFQATELQPGCDMVMDFTHLKAYVLKDFIEHHDHIDWNTKLEQAANLWWAGPTNPTSEVIAAYTFQYISDWLNRFLTLDDEGTSLYSKDDTSIQLHSVTVWESPNNSATYERA